MNSQPAKFLRLAVEEDALFWAFGALAFGTGSLIVVIAFSPGIFRLDLWGEVPREDYFSPGTPRTVTAFC
jgi:hypothetical protein